MNGIVISQQSSVLLALVQQQNEVYLDQFVGEEEGVKECIALLYGAEVELNIGNIGTVLKFSVLHEIQEMFQLAIRWVGRNVCEETLGELLNHALLIETLGKEKVLKIEDVFFELFNFIKNHVKHDLLKLAKDWKIINRKCLIFFLIHPHILDFTLPVLSLLIEGDSDIQEIIVNLERELEHGNISLSAHEDKALDLLDKMSDKVKSLETSKRVMKLQKTYCRSKKKAHQKVVSMGKGDPVGEKSRSYSDKQTDWYGIDLSLDITSTAKEVPSCSSGEVPNDLGSDDSQEVQMELWIPKKNKRIIEGNYVEILVKIVGIKLLDCKPSTFGHLVFTVCGTQQNCLAADRILFDLMEADNDPSKGSMPMWVETCKLGRIIGKKGHRVREIRGKFGVSVEIMHHKSSDDETEVILTGAQLPVKEAMEFIFDLVEQD